MRYVCWLLLLYIKNILDYLLSNIFVFLWGQWYRVCCDVVSLLFVLLRSRWEVYADNLMFFVILWSQCVVCYAILLFVFILWSQCVVWYLSCCSLLCCQVSVLFALLSGCFLLCCGTTALVMLLFCCSSFCCRISQYIGYSGIFFINVFIIFLRRWYCSNSFVILTDVMKKGFYVVLKYAGEWIYYAE